MSKGISGRSGHQGLEPPTTNAPKVKSGAPAGANKSTKGKHAVAPADAIERESQRINLGQSKRQQPDLPEAPAPNEDPKTLPEAQQRTAALTQKLASQPLSIAALNDAAAELNTLTLSDFAMPLREELVVLTERTFAELSKFQELRAEYTSDAATIVAASQNTTQSARMMRNLMAPNAAALFAKAQALNEQVIKNTDIVKRDPSAAVSHVTPEAKDKAVKHAHQVVQKSVLKAIDGLVSDLNRLGIHADGTTNEHQLTQTLQEVNEVEPNKLPALLMQLGVADGDAAAMAQDLAGPHSPVQTRALDEVARASHRTLAVLQESRKDVRDSAPNAQEILNLLQSYDKIVAPELYKLGQQQVLETGVAPPNDGLSAELAQALHHREVTQLAKAAASLAAGTLSSGFFIAETAHTVMVERKSEIRHNTGLCSSDAFPTLTMVTATTSAFISFAVAGLGSKSIHSFLTKTTAKIAERAATHVTENVSAGVAGVVAGTAVHAGLVLQRDEDFTAHDLLAHAAIGAVSSMFGVFVGDRMRKVWAKVTTRPAAARPIHATTPHEPNAAGGATQAPPTEPPPPAGTARKGDRGDDGGVVPAKDKKKLLGDVGNARLILPDPK